jgi:CRISPR-associated protein Cas2
MARRRFIITYDISDPRRLRNVARALEGYGTRLQFSVFECLLDPLRLSKAKSALKDIIDESEDQILFIALGPETTDVGLSLESLGRPYLERTLVTIV